MAPYKSAAQRKYFHYLQEKGKMPKKTVSEFDRASKGMNLPEHVGMADGGYVDDDDMGDDIGEDDFYGHYHPNDSSGEPHTNEYEEEEHPMEYMFGGGYAAGNPGHGDRDEEMDNEEHPEFPSYSEEEMDSNLHNYAHGGKVRRKMARGGMAFARALRMHRK